VGDDGLGVMGSFFLGLASLCGGSLAEAVQLFQQVVTTLAGARAAERFGEPGPPAQFAQAFLGWSLAELGRFAEAIAVGEESLRMAQAIDTARQIDWVPLTCIYGRDENDSICPLLHAPNVRRVPLPGDHYLQHDPDLLFKALWPDIQSVEPGR